MVVSLTNHDINEIALHLFSQIELDDDGNQDLHTTYSTSSADVELTAGFFCGSVLVEEYTAIDEDSKEMAMLDSDLTAIEDIVNKKLKNLWQH